MRQKHSEVTLCFPTNMFILASQSPRRRQLLGELVKEFAVIPSTEEEVMIGSTPREIVSSLALQKAQSVAKNHPSDVVLGSDTIVVFEGKILGKPKTEGEAFETLSALSGKQHSVLTGVSLIKDGKAYCAVEETIVVFNALTKEEILAYIATGSPMDKAGSYGIQDEGIVSHYFGSYTNVVGLPIETVKDLLKQAEVEYE